MNGTAGACDDCANRMTGARPGKVCRAADSPGCSADAAAPTRPNRPRGRSFLPADPAGSVGDRRAVSALGAHRVVVAANLAGLELRAARTRKSIIGDAGQARCTGIVGAARLLDAGPRCAGRRAWTTLAARSCGPAAALSGAPGFSRRAGITDFLDRLTRSCLSGRCRRAGGGCRRSACRRAGGRRRACRSGDRGRRRPGPGWPT